MAIFYTVAQNFEFDFSKENHLVRDMANEVSGFVSGLVAGAIYGQVYHLTIEACIDGEEKTAYSEEESVAECIQKFSRIRNAENKLQLSVSYDYEKFSQADPENIVNIYKMIQEQSEELYNEKIDDKVFYEYYVDMDCTTDTCGCHYAYGKKNGVIYDGEIPFKAVDSIPEGTWSTVNENLFVSRLAKDYSNKEGYSDIIKSMEEIAAFGDNYSNIDDEYVELIQNNTVLKNTSDFNKYTDVVARLLTWFDCDKYTAYFVDYDSNSMRRMMLTIYSDGNYKAEVAEI